MPAIEPETVIDTSKMSAGQRAALELSEGAREAAQAERGFVGGLFMGRCQMDHDPPFPRPDAPRIATRATPSSDACAISSPSTSIPTKSTAPGEIPDEVIDGLAKLGAFGIKIAPEYGGLGLSQTNYCRAGMLLGSYCGNLTALLSAHQSIGVPQPLILFGTEEQKRRFLPRVAGGEISAFALTEPKVGSDPAKMETHAEPDGRWRAFHPERREALVHQWRESRRHRRDGKDAAARRQETRAASPPSSWTWTRRASRSRTAAVSWA